MKAAANGVCILEKSGQKFKQVTWQHLSALQIDVVICAFCGYDLDRNQQEFDKVREIAEWCLYGKEAQVYGTNASAFFSRTKNRLIDGTELLAFLLHRTEELRPEIGCASLLCEGNWIDASEL
eukprot:gb/GEZJ01001014.1/.p2 GENE.gb/GEZJ01001014.1/~~gb/GEZJ01001014.1/.p2  ORF type:complete len:123 (+),score=20.62 gb/GEZJ01001014.1/:1072-1440(+)